MQSEVREAEARECLAREYERLADQQEVNGYKKAATTCQQNAEYARMGIPSVALRAMLAFASTSREQVRRETVEECADCGVPDGRHEHDCPHSTLYHDEQLVEIADALKPFAEAAENLDDNHADRSPIWESSAAMGITAGDLRKVAELHATLSAAAPGKEGDRE